ncbi:MAG: DUF4982 domain-containing protein [Lachnospiraceae bacterium]|nr:DUF4982 domain-containing protein [Lachnospiraceae bacterium]
MISNRLFNSGWQFVETPLDTAYIDIPDDEWREVTLPHDFLIRDVHALYRDATGWYRKCFTLREEGAETADRLFLVFDGVYMDSRYWLNGEMIGEWKYGYSPVVLDLTEHINRDGENELIVSVRHQSPNSRWYSGAGIFRDVRLIGKNSTCIPVNGVYFSAQRQSGNGESWEIILQTEVVGADADDAQICHRLTAPDGREISLTPVFRAELRKDAPFVLGNVQADTGMKSRFRRGSRMIRCVEQRYRAEGIRPWDMDDPVRYRLETKLLRDGAIIDEEASFVGFRTVTLDPELGFFLNGRKRKLNGVCEHHDLGALGAAFSRTAFRRKLRKLREMGVNAIRLTHNMAAEGVLELADEMGFVLISEAFDMWMRPKTDYDYARFFKAWHARDVESWVRRDRNHPSVILWSIGNEIYDTHVDARAIRITAELKALVEKHDPKRNARVTIGSNYMPWEGAQKCADILKIAGYNYGEKCYEEHHAEHPDWVIYGSETASIVQSRGVYHFPLSVGSIAEEDEQCSSLGNSCTSWGAHSFEECAGVDRDLPYSLGQFLWSGFDYIGEPTPYQTKNSYFGQIDTAGFPKDAYFFWQSVWTDPEEKPMVHIIPGYWDFNEGQLIDVRVVSNLDRVALFLNGKSLGEQKLTHAPGTGLKLFADYRVPYTAGELTAVAYFGDEEEEGVRETLYSFGDTAEFRICREPAEEDDELLFYEISAADKNGRPVGNACDRVRILVTGGELAGTDNGDSTDTDSYQSADRRLFNGKLLAIVRKTPGTETDAVRITVERETEETPVRRLVITPDEGQIFTGEKRTLSARVRILPENAADRRIEVRAVTDTGVATPLAKIEKTEMLPDRSMRVTMYALGDGHFRLRAVSASSTEHPRVLSELEYRIEGVGTAYLDPYRLISGSLFTSSIGEVGSGNEKGIVSARDGRTVIIWEGLDFGRDFADKVTLPLFTLNDDAYMIKIWHGIPGETGAKLLVDGIYQKKMIWNVYQEESWTLAESLTGLQTVSVEVDRKFHIKGLKFHRVERAWARIAANVADAIYGDQFRKEEDAVCDIGNNVTLLFGEMDFGEAGTNRIRVTGRGAQANSVHVRFAADSGEEIRQLIEFPSAADFTEREFALDAAPDGVIRGKWEISFVFLPGTAFDLKEFRFEEASGTHTEGGTES